MVQGDDSVEGGGPRRTSPAAVASLILGVLSLCLCLATGLPAIICGAVSLMSIRGSGGRLGGTGFAVTGLVLGLFGSCCGTAGFGYLGFTKVQEANERNVETNNLKQIGLAMHAYSDTYNRLPAAGDPAPDPGGGFPFGPPGGPPGAPDANRPAVSWRVLILPYIEQDTLYKMYRTDEPWDGPNNRQFL